MVKYGRAGQATYGNIIRRVRFAYWMSTATETSSEYVTHFASPLQQWLHERPSILCYTIQSVLLIKQSNFMLLKFLN